MERKYRSLILIGIVIIILALISATYAYWMITKTQTNSNIITSKCLDISISGETNDINLIDAYPISDEEGETTIPYTFTITNNCNSDVDYQVALESIGNAVGALQPESIKVQLDNRRVRTLDEYMNVDTTIGGAYASHKLINGTLQSAGKEGSSRTYNLRLWINESSSVEENGKSFESKISVSIGENIKNIICKAVDSTTITTGNIPSGEYNYGDEYICTLGDEEYNFFLLEDGDSTTLEKGVTGTSGTSKVTLIMDRNYIDDYIPITLAWCTDGGNNNTICKNINTTGSEAPVGKDYIGHITEVFNTPEIIVNFPTKEQMESIGCNPNSWSCPIWVRDYLFSSPNNSIVGIKGYWTASKYDDDSNYAWRISGAGNLHYPTAVNDTTTRGLRPIITISKTNIE